MADRDINARFVITAVDQASARLRAINKSVMSLTEPARAASRSFQAMSRESGVARLAGDLGNTKTAIGGVVGQVGLLGAKLAAAGGAAGWLFKSQFIDTASSYEGIMTTLEAIEGTSEKAKESMDWVSDFAAETPYQLEGVLDSFIQLRNAGMEPANGSLLSMADGVAKYAKGSQEALISVGRAFSQMTAKGKVSAEEMMQLSEQSIPAWALLSKATGRTVAELQDLASKGRLGADAINLLMEALGKDAAGASAAHMKTWAGMISNISDQWWRFKNKVMDGGTFDLLKGKMKALLDSIDAMAASGQLESLAMRVSDGFVAVFRGIETGVPKVIAAFASLKSGVMEVKDFFGSWKPILAGVAAIVAGPLIASLVSLGGAFVTLGATIMATPIGWALAGIAGAALLIWKNWEPLSAWFTRVIENLGISSEDMAAVWSASVSLIGGTLGEYYGYLAATARNMRDHFFIPVALLIGDTVDLFSKLAGGAIAAVRKVPEAFQSARTLFGEIVDDISANWAILTAMAETGAAAIGQSIRSTFEGVKSWVSGMFDGIVSSVLQPIIGLLEKLSSLPIVGDKIGKAAESLRAMSTPSAAATSAPALAASAPALAPALPSATQQPQQQKMDTGGELRVFLQSDAGRFKVESLKSNDPRQAISVDAGNMMAAAL